MTTLVTASPFWALMLAIAFSGPALAQSTTLPTQPAEGLWLAPLVNVPRLEGIAIDGDAADWGDRGVHAAMPADELSCVRTVDDFDVRARLGWNDQGLLVLLVIRDDLPVEAEDLADVWKFDSVELFVADRRGSSNFYQLLISPGADPNHPQPRHRLHDRRTAVENADLQASLGARTRALKTGAESTVELLLPWTNLSKVMSAGSEPAVQIMVNDQDRQDEPKFRAVWYPLEGTDHDTFKMVPLRLADRTGPPATWARTRFEAGQLRLTGWASQTQIGKPFKILQDGKPLAEGTVQDREGRFLADALIPLPAPGQRFGQLGVAVDDGEPTAAIVTPESLAISAVDVEPGQASRFLPRLVSTDKAFEQLICRVKALRSDGSLAEELSGPIGAPLATQLPKGFYRFDVELTDCFGRTLAVSNVLPVGMAGHDEAASWVDTILRDADRPELADAAGWIQYLACKARQALKDESSNAMADRIGAMELTDWARKLKADPALLASLRGRFEWAYLSKVDGTGQPFIIVIPENYDSSRPWPLYVDLHGSGGMHTTYFRRDQWDVPGAQPGGIELAVLGRTRTNGYVGLAEVDVLEAIDYVRTHWNVDPRRIHLSGGSMGGGGTWRIASRHPDMFATARPVCSFGIAMPVENLLHVPVYSIHSIDDWTVPVTASRVPLARLADSGGMVIRAETDGLGHSVGRWTEAVEASWNWAEPHRLPEKVRRVRFTAFDELSRGAYWAEVAEWGPANRPARFDLRLDAGNWLYADMDNVTALRVDLARSAADRQQTMTVVLDGQVLGRLPAPLPETLWLIREGQSWRVDSKEPVRPAFRLHVPDGPWALYHGEPLLIVYGTGGGKAVQKALSEITETIRRGHAVHWERSVIEAPRGERNLMPFGRLPVKADRDVTADDMAKYNLLLLGTARQNSVVARLADKLPVRIVDGRVTTNDGVSWSFDKRQVGLLHCNPEQPQRLIYWVAFDQPEQYKPQAKLMDLQGWRRSVADLVIVEEGIEGPVACRCFDSRWNWQAGYADSPLLRPELCSLSGGRELWTELLRRTVDADFVMDFMPGKGSISAWASGETRVMDVVTWNASTQVGIMELTGAQLLASQEKFARAPQNDEPPVYWPQEDLPAARADRVYRVGMEPGAVWSFSKITQTNPPAYQVVDVDGGAWLERKLVAEQPALAATQPSVR